MKTYVTVGLRPRDDGRIFGGDLGGFLNADGRRQKPAKLGKEHHSARLNCHFMVTIGSLYELMLLTGIAQRTCEPSSLIDGHHGIVSALHEKNRRFHRTHPSHRRHLPQRPLIATQSFLPQAGTLQSLRVLGECHEIGWTRKAGGTGVPL